MCRAEDYTSAILETISVRDSGHIYSRRNPFAGGIVLLAVIGMVILCCWIKYGHRTCISRTTKLALSVSKLVTSERVTTHHIPHIDKTETCQVRSTIAMILVTLYHELLRIMLSASTIGT